MTSGTRLALLLSLLLIGLPAAAQLRASFSADNPSGCAPLAVHFTNTSTGSSAATTWSWTFSNGNASHLKDPAALFTEPGTYTVTLRATEGNAVSEQSLTITVHPAPAATFTASLEKGCAPLPVTWTAAPATGSPAIAQYLWDFGDGQVASTPSAAYPHTYTAANRPTVSLTVTSVHGCRSTMVQDSLVQVLPALKADFTTPDAVLCHLTEPARFTNTSAGPGDLTYRWTFGDGTTSTEKDPSKIFAQRGTYGVRLAVASSEGCTAEKALPTPINAAQFGSDFSYPTPLCTNTTLEFRNTTTATPESATWSFGNGQTLYTYGRGPAYTGYAEGGSFPVTLINSFGRCRDTVTKTVQVAASPDLRGFIAELAHPCGAPVQVTFRDTTAGATAWTWSYHYSGTTVGTTATHVKKYDYPTDEWVYLTVRNAAGCSTQVGKYVNVRRPWARIERSESTWTPYSSCDPLRVQLKVRSDRTITSWRWRTGDGATYTTEELDHTYRAIGYYRPVLVYTTADGCTDSVTYDDGISLLGRPKAAFAIDDTTVCGNTPVRFTSQSTLPSLGTTYHQWWFSDGLYQGYYDQSQNTHQFYTEGTHEVRLILQNSGCADTAIRKVHVTAPFPKITWHKNTCDGDRTTVSFRQESRLAESWQWEFGDGTGLPRTTQDIAEVAHKYAGTGSYKVALTTTAGACTVRDSVWILVYERQPMKLTLDKNDICQNDDWLTMTVSGFKPNPGRDRSWNWSYGVTAVFYADNSYVGSQQFNYLNYSNDTTFSLARATFNEKGSGLKLVTQSAYFLCADTTNVVSLKMRGPEAAFIRLPEDCQSDNLLQVEDRSTSTGSTISRREWTWGNGRTTAVTTGPTASQQYAWPGGYYVTLKVTDATGCTDAVQQYHDVRPRSVEARIQPSAMAVSPGTAVHFANGSTSAGGSDLQYRWSLPGGNEVTTRHADYAFTTPGTYTVRLIARDAQTGCADTASVSILVRYINSVFSMERTLVGTASCPPVLVRFQNFSQNAARTVWDFGDGTVIEGVTHPAHVYTKPGTYLVRLDTYSDNGTRYTTLDSVTIAVPSARLASPDLEACAAQSVTLRAEGDAGLRYLWDFGDGTVASGDTVNTHRYPRAGIYKPKLLLTDGQGCVLPASGAPTVLIDSLAAGIGPLPALVCGPKDIRFQPTVASVAAGAGRPLTYHWDFGTGRPEDTASARNPVFAYAAAGTYTVRLQVASPAGCREEARGTVVVREGLGGSITGPTEACIGSPVTLKGATRLPGNPQWTWITDDGTRVSGATLPPRTYTTAGPKTLQLIIDNGGCADTLTHELTVHALPVLTLNPRSAVVCAGTPLSLTASGAAQYSWTPAEGLSTSEGAAVLAHPDRATTYYVTATNAAGCTARDSVKLRVTLPVSLAVQPVAPPCAGDAITLQASGADRYSWSGHALTAASGPSATARPLVTATYTVIGGDADGCFIDTAQVTVPVRPTPTLNAGADVELSPGASVTLTPTASSDVVTWKWTPAEGLSCTGCPAPVAKPAAATTYLVEVRNAAGCAARDSVEVVLLCTGSRIFIPTAFSPNGDGKNDRFTFGTEGIRRAESIRIYNRWGELLWERKDFDPSDKSAAWNGKVKGVPVPAGGYVYFLELSCDGQKFVRKGTVLVVY